APTDTITFRWLIDALQDTTLVLRLEADLISGRTLEDRVEVAARKNLPVVSGLAFGPVLNGPRLTYEINWITDQPTEGSVVYRPVGALQEELLYSDFIHTVHKLILPERLPAGPLIFQTRSRNTGGLTTISPLETFIYVPLRVPQNGFQERATLPDGFLVDRATDFNRDGRLEIVLMPYVEGRPFNPIEVYERQDTGAFQRVYESTISFLPWSVGDIDADGRTDLVGSEFSRLFLFSGDDRNPFPSQQRLNHPVTWGGEIADIDGDGQNEILARSGGEKGIRILKRQPDGTISEIAFLPDSTTGPGDPGPRFVIADFDGDGLSEILAGDSDGDLWITEYDGVGAYLQTWQNEGNDNTDVRWVGGGVDLDGDGQIEFVAARALSDGDDPLNGTWSLEIYSTTGPNTYALEWASRFSGVQTTGNGIAVGDLDADGNPDLAVTLLPDLYIIRSDAPNVYRPIWHADIGLTHRPLIADLDNNGLPEIVFNQEGAVRIFERTLPPQTVLSPQILRARPLDTRSAEIDWMQTPEAPTYRLYRGVNGAPLELLADGLARTIFIDTTLVEGQTYRYQVAAVLPDNTEIRSDIATVLPNQPPELSQVQPLNTTQLALTFSEPMGAESTRPENYSVLPGLGALTSVIRDREDHRIVLTFAGTFDPQTTYTLHLRNLADASGVLLPTRFNRARFSLNPADPDRIRQADFDDNGTVGFSDFLLFAGAFGSTSTLFDLDGDQTVGFSDFLIFASVFGRQVEA
ncbi:MAG: FG-GAP-like repeat-containing protein, partial [bacterium]|nr:FG-GAP-like repeat-containing protein [bacterium]